MHINESVFLAKGSVVMGDVEIGEGSSVWYNAVIRADIAPVTIGARSNVQDNCVIHVDEGYPVSIGEDVTIGHGAILHGCTVGDNTLIGMGAIILNGACIGRDCIIGVGSLVTQATVIPDGSVAYGSPAQVRRPMTPQEVEGNRHNAAVYAELATERLGTESPGQNPRRTLSHMIR